MSVFGKRILILVPHPDDEVVGFAASIGRAQAEGAEVFALYLTHGCLARGTLWPWQRKNYEKMVARRRAEAEQVAAFLRIIPVGWSNRAARELWPNLCDVEKEVRAVVVGHNIDQIWLPAYEGGNPDHDGLNVVGQKLRRDVGVLEFAEYNFAGGKARAQEFPHPNGMETSIMLTPEEVAKKRAALALYVSEKANLNYVGVVRECFRPLEAYDYTQPPHAGTLWYARFQWVPFRHPRVDFTDPARVSGAIVAYAR